MLNTITLSSSMRDPQRNACPDRVRDRVRMRPEGEPQLIFRASVRQRRPRLEHFAFILRHHAGTEHRQVTQRLRERKLPGRQERVRGILIFGARLRRDGAERHGIHALARLVVA